MNTRRATEEDRQLCEAWIAKDPDHRGMSADFWLKPETMKLPDGKEVEITENMIWEDEQGAIFFFRISRSLRIDIQFDPEQKDRTREALRHGFPWLAGQARAAGFLELIFKSVSRELVRFCQKRFGFTSSNNEFLRFVQGDSFPGPPQGLEKPAQTLRR